MMKPKDLKPVFSFENRRPLLQDQIFYVPEYYSQHCSSFFPSFAEYFGSNAEVGIEYCSGNGDWILEKARQFPDKNWIAVEIRFDRVRKIWSKMKNAKISNLLIVCGEALTFTQHYLQENTVDGIYINFPDPWPKLRHAKHRLMQIPFLEQMQRVLKLGKSVTFVTDDLPYLNETLECFGKCLNFSPTFEAPYYITNRTDYGTSWFEKLWREKGRVIHYTELSKNA